MQFRRREMVASLIGLGATSTVAFVWMSWLLPWQQCEQYWDPEITTLLGERPYDIDMSSYPFPTSSRVPYNPSVARLPVGSAWEYAVTARVIRVRSDITILTGGRAEQNRILGFGANRTESGGLQAVSEVVELVTGDEEKQNALCTKGHWWPQIGPEDARLHWVSPTQIAMTYTRSSTSYYRCKAVGYVHDARTVWEELGEALRPVLGSWPTSDVGEAAWELDMGDGAGLYEKNWAMIPFFPDNPPSRHGLPLFQRWVSPPSIIGPTVVLPPVSTEDVKLWPVRPIPIEDDLCAERLIPGYEPEQFHHATHISHLTLCRRGECEPDEDNTVLIGIVHILIRPWKVFRLYRRSFFVWDRRTLMTLGVGQPFAFGNMDDRKLIFSSSFAFDNPSLTVQQDRAYGPGHGFLDDRMLITMSEEEADSRTIAVSMQEVLGTMRSCDDGERWPDR